MNDNWFDDYMFEIAAPTESLTETMREALKTEPIVLPAWDPMGSLARSEVLISVEQVLGTLGHAVVVKIRGHGMNHPVNPYTNSNILFTQHTRWERITMDQAPPNDPLLSSQDLSLISGHTIRHYDENAADYWEGTKGHDVRQNTEALLTHTDGPGPYSILDFGCGPGRDLMHFTSLWS